MTELVLKNGVKAPFTLSQAAQYDHENNARGKVTGWGHVCKARHEKNKASGKTRSKKSKS